MSSSSTTHIKPDPLLLTLGTAVIDNLHFADGTTRQDVLGGSGVHCAVGARLFLPPPPPTSNISATAFPSPPFALLSDSDHHLIRHSRASDNASSSSGASVSHVDGNDFLGPIFPSPPFAVLNDDDDYNIIKSTETNNGKASSYSIAGLLHVGENDFLPAAQHALQSFNTSLKLNRLKGAKTARNKLTLHDSTMGAQTRSYVHRSLFTQVRELDEWMLRANVVHLICSFEELTGQVDALQARRSKDARKMCVMWEPWPKSCTVENGKKEAMKRVLGKVDVFSPNHMELMELFGVKVGGLEGDLDRGVVEDLAGRCLRMGVGKDNSGVVVVRCGEFGCLLMEPVGAPGDGQVRKVWLPPYHEDGKGVRCTIGAGNAFLGGLAVGRVETGDWLTAFCYGTVAASFLVEQVGLPRLTVSGQDELWNGRRVRARLQIVLKDSRLR